jgi:hypothetical protein
MLMRLSVAKFEDWHNQAVTRFEGVLSVIEIYRQTTLRAATNSMGCIDLPVPQT